MLSNEAIENNSEIIGPHDWFPSVLGPSDVPNGRCSVIGVFCVHMDIRHYWSYDELEVRSMPHSANSKGFRFSGDESVEVGIPVKGIYSV